MRPTHLQHILLGAIWIIFAFSHLGNSSNLLTRALFGSFGCPRSVDPSPTTLLAHPEDCSKFIKCDLLREHVMNCPRGQHWNDAKKYCDFPENVNCLVEFPICPTNRNELIGFPGSCSQYIQCSHGLVYVMSCPAGLFWNESEKRCDYAHKSKCMSGGSSQWPPGSGEEEMKPNCPNITDRDAFIPDPDDCSKYFQCWNGHAVLRGCPSGLHWNVKGNHCDWPYSANCTKSTTQSSSSVVPSVATSTKPQTEVAPTQPTNPESSAKPSTEVPIVEPSTEVQSESSESPSSEAPSEPSEPASVASEELATESASGGSSETSSLVSVTEAQTQSSEETTSAPTESSEKPSTEAHTNESATEPSEKSSTEIKAEQPATAVPTTKSPKQETEAEEQPPDAPTELNEELSSEVNPKAADAPTVRTEELKEEIESTDTPADAIGDTSLAKTPKQSDVPSEESLMESTKSSIKANSEPINVKSEQSSTEPTSASSDTELSPDIKTDEIPKLNLGINNESIRSGHPLPEPQVATLIERFCPPQADMKPAIRFGDPKNCAHYYECLDGTPGLRLCPDGKHWNSNRQKCDKPISAGCFVREKAEFKAHSLGDCSTVLQYFGNSKIIVSCPNRWNWNEAEEVCDLSAKGICRREGRVSRYNPCPYGTHVPFSMRFNDFNDCRRFIQCQNGFAYHLECPNGLRWNKVLGHCDWPEYVSCSKG